jgi:hypothetical protein
MEGLIADVLIQNQFPSFLICHQVCLPTLVLHLYHVSDSQQKISMWYVLTAFCFLQSDSRLRNWNVSILASCSHHFCQVIFFLWLTNCIWLYHIPHLWHLEQRIFKKFWDNCLYQLVCIEDPLVLHLHCIIHTSDPFEPSHGWHIFCKSFTGLISEHCSLGCPWVYVNMFQ